MRDWQDIWRRLFPRRTIARDVDAELDFHVEGRAADLVSQGMTPEEAEAEVLRRFGDVDSFREQCREFSRQRVARQELRTMMDSIGQDVRFAGRALVNNRTFAAVAIITLGLAIGAATAIFSVVNGVLLEPLPYDDPSSLAIIWENDRATGTTREQASVPDYFDFLERARTFADIGMYAFGPATMSRDDGEPHLVDVATVTHNVGEILGIEPQLGRGLQAAEDVPDGELVVVLADEFWRSAFGADPSVLGRQIRVDDRSHTIVGVLPPALDFPVRGVDMWTPIQQSPATSPRSSHWVTLVGRIAPDTTVDDAHAEMVRIAADLEREYPDDNVNRGAFVEPIDEVVRGNLRPTLLVLFGAVSSVLLIACANVANLLLARSAARSQEVAVCVAMGASTGRLIRRFLIESLMLAGAAMVVGVGLAVVMVALLMDMAPGDIQAVGTVEIDLWVLGFSLVLSGAIGVVFGLIPSVKAQRIDVQSRLKEGRSQGEAASRSKMVVRRLLVAGQLAMAAMLLVSASLLIRTLWNLQRVDPGFSADHVLRADVNLPEARYPRDFAVWPDWTEVNGFNNELLAGVRALPGVRTAALTSNHPLQSGFTNSFSIIGRPFDPDQGEIKTRIVSPGYFETVGVGLVRGRLLDATDATGAPPVALLNQAAVEKYFPDEEPVGRQIGIWGARGREIIGIVENEKMEGLDQEAPAALYVNILQAPQVGSITLMVRTDQDPTPLVPAVREVVWSIDPDLAVYRIATMEQTLADAVARERFASVLLAVFAGVALFIASLGVYGLLSYLVAQRSHEVGVRMALGATSADVLRLIVRQGALLTLVGMAVGLAGALAVSRWFEGMLFEISATDPLAYTVVAISLGCAALLACTLPARRAAHIDPIVSLRGD